MEIFLRIMKYRTSVRFVSLIPKGKWGGGCYPRKNKPELNWWLDKGTVSLLFMYLGVIDRSLFLFTKIWTPVNFIAGLFLFHGPHIYFYISEEGHVL
jgi:hypothetical protein